MKVFFILLLYRNTLQYYYKETHMTDNLPAILDLIIAMFEIISSLDYVRDKLRGFKFLEDKSDTTLNITAIALVLVLTSIVFIIFINLYIHWGTQ